MHNTSLIFAHCKMIHNQILIDWLSHCYHPVCTIIDNFDLNFPFITFKIALAFIEMNNNLKNCNYVNVWNSNWDAIALPVWCKKSKILLAVLTKINRSNLIFLRLSTRFVTSSWWNSTFFYLPLIYDYEIYPLQFY